MNLPFNIKLKGDNTLWKFRMVRELLVIVTLFVFLAEYASGEVCEQTYSVKTSSNQSSSGRCGWWIWRRCPPSRTVYKLENRTRQLCCDGSYGSVATGCEGVCPYSDAQSSSACPGNRTCRDYQCDASGVNASSLPTPAVLTFNENDDQERLLWTVDGQCFVQETCPCARNATCTCSKTVPCTHCTVQSTNGIAAVRNGIEIYRKACNETTCRDCQRYPGCLDYNVSYSITVECQASGYIYNDAVQHSFILNVTKAPAPTIKLPSDRMTTTTRQAPTTQTEDEAEYMCMAADSWKLLPGMDLWCKLICGKLGNACPYLSTHCICQDIASEHLNCRGGGLYADTFCMDAWCDLNCNMGISSNCPTNTSLPAYCVCN